MNTRSDFDRRAAAYLADGPTELSGRVLDAALREVHQTRQRRRWSAPWRFQQMLSVARLAAFAALAALAVVGVALMGGTSPNPSPSPTPTAVPASPRACLVTPVDGQLLADDCTYEIDLLGVPISVEGTGHFQYSDEPGHVTLQGIDESSAGGTIEIIRVRSLPASPCEADGVGLPGSAPSSAEEYLAWLAESPVGAYPVTAVTVAGLSGRRLSIPEAPLPTRTPDEPACDMPWLAGGEIMGIGAFGLGLQAIAVDVLEADGQVFLVVVHHAGLQPEDDAGLQAQLDGLRFDP